MKNVLISLLLASFSVHAVDVTPNKQDRKQIKALISNYLLALKNKDEKKLKQVVSKKYFGMLKAHKILKKTFEMQTKPKPGFTPQFDMKVEQGVISKDLFFVNIKDKKQDHYHDYWYHVRKISGKFVIDDEQHRD